MNARQCKPHPVSWDSRIGSGCALTGATYRQMPQLEASLTYNWAMPGTHVGDDLPAPKWPICSHAEGDDVCTGRRVEGASYCLAHVSPDQLDQALRRLHPGADLDASGTPINAELLSQILRAVQKNDEPPEFGLVSFTQAHFSDNANFTHVKFTGNAFFEGTRFTGEARFSRAQFSQAVKFSRARFSRDAIFGSARFIGDASFGGAQFDGSAVFGNAVFAGSAVFGNALFARSAGFNGAQFADDTRFAGARFAGIARFGAKFAGDARFDSAQFATTAIFRDSRFASNTVFGAAQFGGAAAFGSAQFDGNVTFGRAQFTEDAVFGGARFGGLTRFEAAQFNGDAVLDGAQFIEKVTFGRAQFSRDAMLRSAQFSGEATFDRAQFSGDVAFDRALFRGDAGFDRAVFSRDAGFERTQFREVAGFEDAEFQHATYLGPLVAKSLSLRRATFGSPLVIEASAVDVSCRETTWRAGVTLRVRYATVDLERATFTISSFVTGSDQPFESPTGVLNEYEVRQCVLADRGESLELWVPILTSLRGSDSANLTVTDVDLSQCRFAGARLLDQLRLEGRCIFDHPPRRPLTGWAWLPVWRWSDRQTIFEERTWRARTRKYAGWRDTGSASTLEISPERLAGLYRQLRKAQEDAKNEPGAADFYYGEMEMRRHTRSSPIGERAIIWLYWLFSGYGLRALRSLAALVILAAIVTTVITGWGLAATAPATTLPQRLAGTVTTKPQEQVQINATLGGITPELPPVSQRWTRERAQTALEVTFESLVFRSTDQPLTTAGTWTTIAARILGPILLALTLLAVRNRVKR